MASIFSRNVLFAGKLMARSLTSNPSSFQFSRNFSTNPLISKPSQSLVFSRHFADSSSGKNHLKDGLPEQYQWTANHLETYLRNFAKQHNLKQEDADHLISTFVKGSTAAQDFFKLDRDSLAAKVGKESPDRTKMGNLLVAEVWKETQAVGQKMQNYGAILIGIACVIFGAWAVNSFTGDKKDDKHAKNDKKTTHDAKDSAKTASKDAKGVAHDAKETVKEKTAQAFKEDGAIGKQFTEKGAIGGTAQKIGGPLDKEGAIGKQFTTEGAVGGKVQQKAEEKEAAHGKSDKRSDYYAAKDSAKDYARDAKESVKDAARGSRDNAKDNAEDAKKKTAQAFKDDGAVGRQFTEKGAIGGAAQKIGGPLDKEGAIGKQFTKDGAIGGKVQQKAEEKEDEAKNKSRK